MAQTNEGNSSVTDIQQVLEVGMAAAQLMQSPVFDLAYRETVNQCFNQWVATPAQHVKEREAIHSQVTALKSVTQTLMGFWQQADAVQLQQDEEQFRAEEYQ